MKDNLTKIMYKLRYITEFIFVIFSIIFLKNLICTKIYYGYFHKVYLIFGFIFSVLSILNLIYNIKNKKDEIEHLFLSIAIPIGLLYAILMIPGHVPDETTHFYKAYDLANGNIITKISENGSSYIEVPSDLIRVNHVEIVNYNDLKTLENKNTDYQKTEKIISSAQGNASIMYIIPAIGFLIGKICNMNIIYAIYLGRILNLIFFLILGFFAIKRIPFGKLLFAIYMLMPMNLQQIASISADSFINSFLFYYIAYSMYLIYKKEKITKKEITSYIILTCISGIIKIVYIILAGVGFLIIKRKDITKKQKIGIICLTIILGGFFSLTTYKIATRYSSLTDAQIEYNERLNVNNDEQIKLMKNESKHALKAYFNDWYYMQKHYAFMAIGYELGWLEIKTSETVITLYLILLIISALLEKNEYEFGKLDKLWMFLIFAGICILVEFAMYTGFTPVGAEFIGGIQGRYYIPTYILLLLCLSRKKNTNEVNGLRPKNIMISGILNIAVICEIFLYFR